MEYLCGISMLAWTGISGLKVVYFKSVSVSCAGCLPDAKTYQLELGPFRCQDSNANPKLIPKPTLRLSVL